MAKGRVETLLMLGGNPLYNAPMELGLNGSVRLRCAREFTLDFTTTKRRRACHWHCRRRMRWSRGAIRGLTTER